MPTQKQIGEQPMTTILLARVAERTTQRQYAGVDFTKEMSTVVSVFIIGNRKIPITIPFLVRWQVGAYYTAMHRTFHPI